ncbi:AAA family ATPase [Microvirga sp. KLBC 81]|uniref:AAA family ATPase n=1 Tax=Microvirga sp. KLBC 81 TaxID=1862707 RepID=UPI00140416E2|nr:AAA family ATPase [Microvirga sp. KLBC 81]
MTFTFAPAKRERVSLLIALAGASGSGKTYSALELATGMSPEGKIAFIDTEARRGLHYADRFKFMHSDMRPPFRPERFIEGIRAAESAGAEVVIIDSFSHEYDGEGGIMDWADELAESGVKSPGNWKDPKLAHKKMMNALLQCRASLIFCLRADEKISIDKKEVEGSNGRTFMKTVITPLGWMPICEKRFMYEMTASFTLTPDRPGRPNFSLPHKLQDQHRGMFTDAEPISRKAGQLLAEWARGGSPAPSRRDDIDTSRPTAAPVSAQTDTGAGFPGDEPQLDPRVAAIIDDARVKADEGLSAYREFFGGLAPEGRAALVESGHHEKLKARAERAGA